MRRLSTSSNGCSARERLQACLRGERPDRTPVALWRHFPVDDQSPHRLAAATSAFQHLFDFDFVKVTPSSSFSIRDWGATDRWTGSPEGTRDYDPPVIHQAADWEKLKILDPRKGSLGNQLECLKILIKEFSPSTPILQTVFSPLAQAKNLAGARNLILHLRRNPDAVQKGLEIITRTTMRFIDEAFALGIDGVFYAVQHAQYSLLTEAEFEVFGRGHDLPALQAATTGWLNMLHLHGDDVMFDQVSDYPVQIINWHDRNTPPSLPEAAALFKGMLCGGLRRWETMVLGTPEGVETEARDAIHSAPGGRFILGTGCVLPVIAPYGNIHAAVGAAQTCLT